MDGLKKRNCVILRHTDATMTCGVSRQVACVHAERLSTKAHVIGHRHVVNGTDMPRRFPRHLEVSGWVCIPFFAVETGEVTRIRSPSISHAVWLRILTTTRISARADTKVLIATRTANNSFFIVKFNFCRTTPGPAAGHRTA
jgi:hypothetical protein